MDKKNLKSKSIWKIILILFCSCSIDISDFGYIKGEWVSSYVDVENKDSVNVNLKLSNEKFSLKFQKNSKLPSEYIGKWAITDSIKHIIRLYSSMYIKPYNIVELTKREFQLTRIDKNRFNMDDYLVLHKHKHYLMGLWTLCQK